MLLLIGLYDFFELSHILRQVQSIYRKIGDDEGALSRFTEHLQAHLNPNPKIKNQLSPP